MLSFLRNIKYLKYKIGIQFNKNPLFVDQNICATKTVNAYIIYDLDLLPKRDLKSLTIKNCFLSTTIVRKQEI